MKTLLPRMLAMCVIPMMLVGCDGSPITKTGQQVVVGVDEVHEGWLFASGDEVLIMGTVEGDLYVAGGMIQIDGTVNGDVLVAGGVVRIGGRVSDDVRAAGGNIECSGNIGKNLTAAGGTIALTKTAVVEGGVLAAGAEIRLGGVVEKDVVIAGDMLQIEGIVGGDVWSGGKQVSTLPGAAIHGDFHARVPAPEQARIAAGTVDGLVEISTEKREPQGTILGYSVGRFWFKIAWAVSLILTAIVVILVSRRSVEDVGRAIWERPGWGLLWGVIGIILTPLAAIALCITLVGIPLGIAVLMVYLWFLYLSQIALGVVVGQRVFMPENIGRLIIATIAGIVLVQVLTFVPYLGTLVIIAGILLGLGGIVDVARRRFSKGVRMSPPLA